MECYSSYPVRRTSYFTKAAIPRALDEKKLMHGDSHYNLKGKSYPTVKEALDKASKNSGREDLIIIFGSTFVIAGTLAWEVMNY